MRAGDAATAVEPHSMPRVWGLRVDDSAKGAYMAAKRLSAVYLAVLLLCFSTLGWAQSNSGVITGTVVDSTGAVAPGVSVTVTDLKRGVKSSTKSNDAGVFAVPALTVGDYR